VCWCWAGSPGLLSREIKSQQRSITRETNRNSGFITESLRNIELIKSLGLTFPEIRRLQAQTTRIFALEMQKVKRIRLLSFLQGTTLSLLKLAVLFALLWLIFRDVLSTGELIAMQFISVAIFAPLQELGNIILAYREAEASLLNFEALMQKPIERRPESPISIGPVTHLRFADVSFRHKGAMDNALDERVVRGGLGDTIAFVGPSGSGKSTLVKLLVGLYTPASGEVFYNDISTRDLRYNQARRQIGFVTQETICSRARSARTCSFVKPDATDEEILEAMRQASCAYLPSVARGAGHAHRRARHEAVGRREAAAVDCAGAGAGAAPADLRRGHLGARFADRRADHHHRARDFGAQHADHDPDRAPALDVMHAGTIHVLEKGRIVESGTHAALVEGKGLYYAMWRQQIGERPVPRVQEAETVAAIEPPGEAEPA
jgi:ATP-binding cassette subfamily B protein